jgi:hypothetical protein
MWAARAAQGAARDFSGLLFWKGHVKKSELLRALQTEIQKHNLSTYMDEKDKIVMTGCSFCRRHFGTVEQFKRHITEDVLPPLLDKLSR